MPTINDRIGSQNVIRVLSNASAPPSRVNNLLDINAGRKDDTDATGLLLIWDKTSAQYILGNDIAHGLNITGLTTFTRLEATGVSLSGVTTAATLSATTAISMGATSIINIDRQLQNIASLDATTTETIDSAIVNSPKLILADEPTGALDSKTSSEVMSLIQEINKSGKTILVVTHEEDIAKMCKRVVRLKDGVIVDDKKINQKVL